MSNITPLRKDQAAPDNWLRVCLEQILRPIVRLFLSRRVAFPAFMEMAKKIYIDLAHEEAIKNDPRRRVTISGLAIATGIDPPSIKSQLSIDPDVIPQAPSLSPESAVLESWAEDLLYRVDPTDAEIMDLPIYGSGRTFQTLVRRSTSANVGYAEILDKLIESGNVEIGEGGRSVVLRNRFYSTCNSSTKNMMQSTSQCIEHFLSAFNRNLTVADAGDEERFTFFQQERWTRKLPPEVMGEFREEMRAMLRRQMKYSESKLTPFEDPVSTDSHLHAGVGYYYFEVQPEND